MRCGNCDGNEPRSVSTREKYWDAARSLNDHSFVITLREISRRSAQLNPYNFPAIITPNLLSDFEERCVRVWNCFFSYQKSGDYSVKTMFYILTACTRTYS
jgi:hypothetical protein